MWTTIECAGHPRDMGIAQGAAVKAAIRGEIARVGLPLRRSRKPTLRGFTDGPIRGKGADVSSFAIFRIKPSDSMVWRTRRTCRSIRCSISIFGFARVAPKVGFCLAALRCVRGPSAATERESARCSSGACPARATLRPGGSFVRVARRSGFVRSRWVCRGS